MSPVGMVRPFKHSSRVAEGKSVIQVVSFYKFINIKAEELHAIGEKLREACLAYNILGTIILATEGVSGKLSGEEENIYSFQQMMQAELPELGEIYYQITMAAIHPFSKLKLKFRKEIVSFKVEGLNVADNGKMVSVDKWNELLEAEDCLVLDARNKYEITFGTFPKSINPQTDYFWQLADWVRINLKGVSKDKKIAMFCTEGIRCEKVGAMVRQMGFDNVYQLQGGIMKYLLETSEATTSSTESSAEADKAASPMGSRCRSLWEGDLFLFDDRVAVDSTTRPVF